MGFASGGAVYRYQPPPSPAGPAPREWVTGLGAPIPNPFLGETRLPYTLARAGHARLEVFDPVGRHVVTLADGVNAAGAHEVRWDGTDARGRPLPAGVYFYRLTSGGEQRAGEAFLFR